MPTSIADLYAAPPLHVTHDLADNGVDGILKGTYYDHMPEWQVAGVFSPETKIGSVALRSLTRTQPNELVEGRTVHQFWDDPRRFWRVAVIAYADRPFMVVCNAGREGDDYAMRYVTDARLYDHAVSYLNALRLGNSDVPITNTDYAEPDLLEFYGHRLSA